MTIEIYVVAFMDADGIIQAEVFYESEDALVYKAELEGTKIKNIHLIRKYLYVPEPEDDDKVEEAVPSAL